MAHPGVWASVGLARGLVRQQVSKPAWSTQLATHYATVSSTAASFVPSSTTCPAVVQICMALAYLFCLSRSPACTTGGTCPREACLKAPAHPARIAVLSLLPVLCVSSAPSQP